jgi:outer membrane protein assembly factor BamB
VVIDTGEGPTVAGGGAGLWCADLVGCFRTSERGYRAGGRNLRDSGRYGGSRYGWQFSVDRRSGFERWRVPRDGTIGLGRWIITSDRVVF